MGLHSSRLLPATRRALDDVGVRLCPLRLLLLLAAPPGPHRRTLLGVARGPSPNRGVQPHYGLAAAWHKRLHQLGFLPSAGALWSTTHRISAGRSGAAFLPVLAPYPPHRPPRRSGPLDPDTFQPPCAPRPERYLPRQELCGRVSRL